MPFSILLCNGVCDMNYVLRGTDGGYSRVLRPQWRSGRYEKHKWRPCELIYLRFDEKNWHNFANSHNFIEYLYVLHIIVWPRLAESSDEYARPKVYENCHKKVLWRWFTLVKKVKKGQSKDFQSQFCVSKIIRISLENMNLGEEFILLKVFKTLNHFTF